MAFGASKVCVACGQDVTHQPRTKDHRGRYFCTPCYEQAVSAHKAAVPNAASAKSRSAPAEPDVLGELLEDGASQAAPPRVCPACWQPLDSNAALCVHCGHRLDSDQVVQTAIPSEQHEPDGFMRALLWPVYLYFKPDTFFRIFAREHVPALTMFFALLIGLATAADRIDTRAAMAQLGGRPFPIPDQWTAYWAVVCVTGFISALLYVYLGGWWYRTRLKFCGEKNADPAVARRAYIFSWAPMAMPAILVKLIETVNHARPSDAWNAPINALDVLVMLCLMWSVWVSFRGVRTLFNTRMIPAIIWFLALPLAIYTIAVVVLIVAVVASMFVGNPMPAVAAPTAFSSNTWSFQYPGNWFIDDAHEDYDPDYFVIVEPVQDAYLALGYRDGATESPEEMMEFMLEELKLGFGQLSELTEFTHWGGRSGLGRRVSMNNAGDLYYARVFVAQVRPDALLIVHEVALLGDLHNVQPGFDQVSDTFTLKP